MVDIVTFGESMVLYTPQKNGRLSASQLFEQSFGGAESNVAIGLARLGMKAGWFSRLGEDPFGDFILKQIRGEGVDVSKVIRDKHHETGVMFKEITGIGNPNVYYYRKLSAASYLEPEDLDEDYIRHAKILHLTGITSILSESCLKTVYRAIEIAKENNVKVCFDPNLRLKLFPIHKARPILLRIASMSDYFLPGLEELQLLFDSRELHSIIDNVRKLNIPVTVIKQGEDGCLIVDQEGEKSIPSHRVSQVVDTVGAGDGFCAGFLFSIVRKTSIEDAATFANAVGAHVVQFLGDIEGLPTKDQIEQFMNNKMRIER
ncbi:sugar kinase [Pontibacillus sp. HMF3514]|uniref:sugar kinase n=1 Tax=Pontibacillus sp. HMF3514 TaxID=2692425 RepID=UPI0019174668|nr:sugar kinase [Pontibacillus sp. HMF3514]